jgi:hypothetical protein
MVANHFNHIPGFTFSEIRLRDLYQRFPPSKNYSGARGSREKPRHSFSSPVSVSLPATGDSLRAGGTMLAANHFFVLFSRCPQLQLSKDRRKQKTLWQGLLGFLPSAPTKRFSMGVPCLPPSGYFQHIKRTGSVNCYLSTGNVLNSRAIRRQREEV